MPKQDEDWAVKSDLIDDFDFTVTGAKFAYQGDDAETVAIIFEGDTSDEDTPRLDEENENALKVKVGKRWVVTDDGTKIEHDTGKRKPLNPNSHYGMWVAECLDTLGIGGVLKDRGSMRDAEVWLGLSFHIVRKEFTGEIDGEKRKWSKALPVKFLGEAGSGSGSGKVTKLPAKPKAATKAAAAKAEDAGDEGDGTGAGDLLPEMEAKTKAKLTALAKTSGDFAAFVSKAFDLDEVAESAELQAFLMEEASWELLKG